MKKLFNTNYLIIKGKELVKKIKDTETEIMVTHENCSDVKVFDLDFIKSIGFEMNVYAKTRTNCGEDNDRAGLLFLELKKKNNRKNYISETTNFEPLNLAELNLIQSQLIKRDDPQRINENNIRHWLLEIERKLKRYGSSKTSKVKPIQESDSVQEHYSFITPISYLFDKRIEEPQEGKHLPDTMRFMDDAPSYWRLSDEQIKDLNIKISLLVKEYRAEDECGKFTRVGALHIERENKQKDILIVPGGMEDVSSAESMLILVDLLLKNDYEIDNSFIQEKISELKYVGKIRRELEVIRLERLEKSKDISFEEAVTETKKEIKKIKEKINFDAEMAKNKFKIKNDAEMKEELKKYLFKINGVTTMSEFKKLSHVQEFLKDSDKSTKMFVDNILMK